MKLTTTQLQKQLPLPQMIKTMELLELGQLELKELIEQEKIKTSNQTENFPEASQKIMI